MKTTTHRHLFLSAILAVPLMLAFGCAENGKIGTSHEVSHNESTTKGWFGGTTHAANTVYKNSDGSTSVETETTTTKNGTTTITRERKTTGVDGSVKVDTEHRTIVAGSDHVTTESRTTN